MPWSLTCTYLSLPSLWPVPLSNHYVLSHAHAYTHAHIHMYTKFPPPPPPFLLFPSHYLLDCVVLQITIFLKYDHICRLKKKPELKSDSVENNSEVSSSIEEIQVLKASQTKPSDDDITSSPDISNIDLGTLGRKPFAMEGTVHNSSIKRRVSNASELGMILEHSEPHDSDEETTGVFENVSVQSQGSYENQQRSKGTRTSESKDEGTRYVCVQNHEDAVRLLDDDSLSCDLDVGEGSSSPDEDIGRRDSKEEGIKDGDYSSRRNSGSSSMTTQVSGRRRRRSSFLVPFFNRRESFTLSFFKPSQSALKQKQERERDTHRHSQAHDTALLSQEEIEMEEDGQREEGKRVKATLLCRQARSVREGLKTTLLNLRLFLW